MPLKLVYIREAIGEIRPAALREKTASKYVHLSINTFRREVRAGRIIAHRRGKQRLFLRWDLDTYLNSLPLDVTEGQGNDSVTSSPTSLKERGSHGD